MQWLSSSPRIRWGVTAVATAAFAGGGGAWAVAASSKGSTIKACANKRTGALRLARTCRPTERRVSWNQAGPAGERGQTGALGPAGPSGPNGFSFHLGPAASSVEQASYAAFGNNQIRLKCGGIGHFCRAQIAMSGGGGFIVGVDVRGPMNAPATSTATVYGEVPSITTLTAVSEPHQEGVGQAVVRLGDGTGWQVNLALVADGESTPNVSLVGTAVPVTTDGGSKGLCAPGFVACT